MLTKKGRCAKQEVTAIIVNKNGKHYIGSNWCKNPQKVCPRDILKYKSGEGYELCKKICKQNSHAEIDACKIAKKEAKGSTLYLIGHTYCCDNCQKIMKQYGIDKIIIGEKI